MRTRWRIGLVLALVAGLCLFHARLKTAKIFANPSWDPQDDVGQFWSEFAFQYRFARFFAEHPAREWKQLGADRTVQHPEPVNDWQEFALAMEVPAGVLYRLVDRLALPMPPFHVWVVWYDCAVSSLAVAGVFLLAWALWRRLLAGLVAAVFYASLYPSYGRTVKNLFPKEDFAVPLILLALWLTVTAARAVAARRWSGHEGWFTGRDKQSAGPTDGRAGPAPRGPTGLQILAGLAWLAALASWHLTPFVLAVLLGATVIFFLWRGEAPRLPWLALVLAVGAFVVPVLRAKQFILSPAMCLLFGLALAMWVDGPRRKRAAVLLAGTLIWAGLGLAIGTAYGEYAHVYELFLYKARYLGVKPADPARLPWEARCLWETAFQTANWSEFWRSLQWCGPLAAVAAWRVLWGKRREEDPGQRGNVEPGIVLFTLLLVPLSWMVVRYFTLLGFAAAVLAGGCAVLGRTARARTCWAVGVGVLALWQFAQLDGQPLNRGPVRPAAYRPVVAWLRENTPPDAVLLASVSESPVFWAYTDRPIVLHSKFETRTMRDRYQRFLEALYGREDQFAALAEHWAADYFIYDVGCLLTGPNTWRYKADRLADLPPDSFARRCWEQPAALERFREVFRTERFVVFAVVRN